MMPERVSNLQMPWSPCASRSFVISNVSIRLVFSSINLRTRWLGRQSTASAASLSSSRPACAWRWRRAPSHSNGRVAMASTSAPASRAARARTGLAPVPVPPPRPATITTTSAPAQSLRNCSASSSAAARPTSGSPPDRRRKFRLVQRRFQSADGVGFAQGRRQPKNLLGQFLNLRNARAAAAKENPGAKVVEQTGLADFLGDEPKNLLHPQGHDATEVFQVDGALGQTMTVCQRDGLALHTVVHQRGAVFDLESFGPTERDL